MKNEDGVVFVKYYINGKVQKIGIGMLPTLKKPCLYIYERPNAIRKVASFNNDEEAQLFIKYLGEFVDATERRN